ncbi:non-ribosomal peptide synthetase [Streptomyces litchfieldiae]|uniref:Amino acid adenylation domain-containing protein n=1 Tax=Streptomyces litchfieldiae TaxID=3075543 RepID=A0ABU2MQM6_9ACTN|nr:non-ribosomal peptide synthetase [Streptomyces sp. DSM 44938]MDT0343923.1 amino acid adenylation domain-containing protein [Streptomyces sp. DSM 44938]
MFPASRAQYQLFFLQNLLGDAPTYNVGLVYELQGALDEYALRSALLLVMERHEALRTHFALDDGALLQVVDPDAPLDYLVTDGTDRSWIDEQARRPFDLERGPLFRARLRRQDDARATLLLSMHHIIVDGWSAGILLDEIVTGYEALAAGRQPDLPDPEFHYADYSGWQEAWLAGPEAARQLDFWRSTLGGTLPVLRLPSDVATHAGPTGSSHRFALRSDATGALRALAGATDSTMFVVLLAAFALLLRGRAGNDDIIVGTAAANRGRGEFHRTIGLFVNAVAIRSTFHGDPTFRELVRQVRRATLEAVDNQEVPFDLVVRELAPERALDHDPVFQVLFTLNEKPGARHTSGGVRFEPIELPTETSKFQLTLAIIDQGETVDAEFEYRADLFSEQRIGQFADEFCRIVESAAADPDQPVTTLARPGDPEGDEQPARPGSEWEDPAPYSAPTNPTEATLAGIFAKVLGLEQVGIDDNYFEMGGDSIRSVQILAQVRAAGLELRLTDLILHQTIRELAPLVIAADETPESPIVERCDLLSPADRDLVGEDVEDAYPLLTVQAGMLYHSEATETHQIYHNVMRYRLRAEFSATAWEQAVKQLLTRHEMLRTSFAFAPFSEPVQLVHREVAVPMTFEDLRGLDDADRRAAVGGRLHRERARPFDLDRAPLIRFHVQRLSEDTVQLWIAEHHAIIDGWSDASLFAELLNLYVRELGHQREIPPPPKARFRSIVAAERAAVADPRQREFWVEQLRDAAVTRLPRAVDDTAPADMRMTEFSLPNDLSTGVLELAKSLKVPVRIVLLAAHVRVMALLGGQPDVVTGAVYHGRGEESDSDRVIGLFLNIVPFRCRPAGGSWADLIAQVAAVDLEIQPNRRFPLAEIQREQGVGTLLESFFNYTHFHVSRSQPTGDVEVLDEEGVVPTSFPFGTEFFRSAESGEIGFALRHDATRLSAEWVERAHGYYLNALTGMVRTPERAYTATLLLSADESRRLATWNDTTRAFPEPHVLPELVRRRALVAADAPAVVCETTTLTHGELDDRVGRLARRLIDLGVRPGQFVGVSMRRSAELVVSLLAVLRAGAAYVPLPPDNPPDRLAAMVAEAGLELVLTDAEEAPGPQLGDARTEMVTLSACRRLSGTVPEVPVLPDDPACLILTFGSTGRPEGVVVSHRALCNRLLWAQDEYPMGADDALVRAAPFSSDVSLWEFFRPLLVGARLVICRPGGHREPAYLRELIQRHEVGVVHLAPSTLRTLLDEGGLTECASLRRVFCGGETLSPDLRRRFRARHSAELVNLYGATAAGGDVTHWRCRDDGRRVVPIGRPIANVTAHVLDSERQPVPAGLPGELYVGGAGVARGHHGDAPDTGVTSAPFFDHTEHGRLYRTGDLARHLTDGELEYLGRLDEQVKLRGLWVRLGEIDAALRGHESVRDCAALVRDEALVACVVPVAAERGLDTAALRAFAAERLAGHMVPQVWLEVPEIPLLAGGEADREGLAGLVRPGQTAGRPYRPAGNDVERELVALWEEALDTRPIGIDDTFYELGGQSLVALRLITAIRRRFDRHIPLVELIRGGSVARLAALLERQAEVPDDGALLVPLRAEGDRAPLILIHPGGGGVFCYKELAARISPRHPVLGLAAAGLRTGVVGPASVGALAADYLKILLAHQPTGPYHLAGWSFGGVVAHEVARLLHEGGASVDLLCLVDSAYPGQLHVGGDDELDALLRAELAAPAGPEPEDREALLGVLRHHMTAHARHRPTVYPGNAVFVQGDETHVRGNADLWRPLIGGEFTVRRTSVPHYDLMRPPHVAAVAGVINGVLGGTGQVAAR